jgi:hypothetical protein
VIANSLRSGHYPIVRGYISPYSGRIWNNKKAIPHWMVVAGLSEDGKWVKIYNPFNNQIERYTWDYFQDNWYMRKKTESGDYVSTGLWEKAKPPVIDPWTWPPVGVQ